MTGLLVVLAAALSLTALAAGRRFLQHSPVRQATPRAPGPPLTGARRGLASTMRERRTLALLAHPRAVPVVVATVAVVLIAVAIGIVIGAALVSQNGERHGSA